MILIKLIISALTALVQAVLNIPHEVVEALRYEMAEFRRAEVLRLIMSQHWAEGSDLQDLRQAIMRSTHITLMDWYWSDRCACVHTLSGRLLLHPVSNEQYGVTRLDAQGALES